MIWDRSRFEEVPESKKRRRKMRDGSEWIRTRRPELAVVSEELWDGVQARLNFLGAKPSQGRRRGLLTRSLTSPYLFSGLLKCGECGANLIVGTGGGTHRNKKYLFANYFNRGTCKNDLYIRRDVLEDRLLGRLQSEFLRPEGIDYAVSEFGRQLRGALLTLADNLSVLRRRKEQLDGKLERSLLRAKQDDDAHHEDVLLYEERLSGPQWRRISRLNSYGRKTEKLMDALLKL